MKHALGNPQSSESDNISGWTLQSDGAAVPNGTIMGIYAASSIALDPSYKYLYISQVNANNGASQILSATYNPKNGDGTILSGPLSRPNDTADEIAVSP